MVCFHNIRPNRFPKSSHTMTMDFKGVTPPISNAMPTQEELRLNDALVEELKRQNNFETPMETERRKKVLSILQKVAVEFVKEVMTSRKKYPPSVINSAGGKIFTYGSYRLEVYGPGSDIDTLLVAPKDITRDDFFETLPAVLKKHSPPDAIEEMTPVPEAFVPIIKLEYMGVSIDLIFSNIQVSSVPLNMDLKDNNLLRGLDDRSLRSVNGTRVTDEILELVPQQKVFRTALRAIKLWSKQRAIYANIMGFPGGVVWAMLVARVCQLYPTACASVIVGKFFRIIGGWPWPQPVLLKTLEDGPLQVKVWNPSLYPSDKYHLMPIITPAYPSMCATHNVTMSTRTIVTTELKRGGDLCDKIFTGKLAWEDLFIGHTFFTQDYKYYLSIVSSSRTKEAQQLWSGLVESKVRHLVGNLDHNELISLAHPFNKGFERVHRCHSDEGVLSIMRGDLTHQVKDIKTETTDATNDPKHNAAAEGIVEDIKQEKAVTETNGAEVKVLYTTTYYIGLQLSQRTSNTLSFLLPKYSF